MALVLRPSEESTNWAKGEDTEPEPDTYRGSHDSNGDPPDCTIPSSLGAAQVQRGDGFGGAGRCVMCGMAKVGSDNVNVRKSVEGERGWGWMERGEWRG
ncbi:hypothetical protein E2C01_023193 [Portunus trituberculatus]|uniref:Uncharacterized protein n=1 Tax=Portunus trituberculatus TaxID=210409 RepID=A0A5B7E858_PORTR|nr:hypothetical protein [Portunus trituberculatus]